MLGKDKSYFVKNHSDSTKKVLWNWYHQNTLVFDWQHICYVWWKFFFQQTIGTDYVALHADWFLYIYEADSLQGPLKKNEKKLAWSFNFLFRYIHVDDNLSLNNCKFSDFVDRIFPIELKIKDTTCTARSASCLDLHLSEGWLRTKLYDKGVDFILPIVNFPFICSNIPASTAYQAYISQLIRYSRACGSYHDFLDRRLLLRRKLQNQGFLLVKLKSSLRKFYCCHHDLVNHYERSASQITTDMFHLS
jgi:hypothetical protein